MELSKSLEFVVFSNTPMLQYSIKVLLGKSVGFSQHPGIAI